MVGIGRRPGCTARQPAPCKLRAPSSGQSAVVAGRRGHDEGPDEAWLSNAIFDAHRDDPEFGYRFLADEVRLADHQVSDRVVWRICRDHQWWSRFGLRGPRPSANSPTS